MHPISFRFSDPYLNRFLQPDSIIPSLDNPQTLNRYSYVGNNPIMNNDPTGHKCGTEDDCKTPRGGDPLPGDPIPTDPNVPNKGKGKGGNGGSEGSGSSTNPIDSITNAYVGGWQTFGAAWSNDWNPGAPLWSKIIGNYYMGAWFGSHILLGVGVGMLAWQAAIPLGAKLATQGDPDATWTMLGRYYSEADNYMVEAEKTGAQYFNLGKFYEPLNAIGLAEPINKQFIVNQMAEKMDFVVYGSEQVPTNLAMETTMIYDSGLYTEIGDVGNPSYSNFYMYSQ